jgi:hypothetical protein
MDYLTQLKYDCNCDLFIDYDYSKHFNIKIYEENEELNIIEYTRI